MASRTVRARLDDESAAALRFLVRMGMTESEAVRTALLEAHRARTREDALREECERLMADPEGVAHTMRVYEEMESIGAPWPD